MTHAHDGGIFDNTTGDIAADSYNKYLDDVACLQETGVSIFSHFSINWIIIDNNVLGQFLPIFIVLVKTFTNRQN